MALGDAYRTELNKVIDSFKGRVPSLAQAIIQVIRQRTRSGRDRFGAAFQQYNEDYANHKKGGATQPVTLTDTGEFLDSLTVLNTDFTSDREVAFDLRAGGARLRDVQTGRFVARDDVRFEIGFPGGRNAKLAGLHTFGGYGKAGNPGPREFMGLTPQEEDEMGRSFANRIYQAQGTQESISLQVSLG